MVNGQDFINAITQDIEIVRGDTLSFNFQLSGLGQEEATITFTCKENPADDTAVFSVSTNSGISLEEYDAMTDTATYTVRIPPAATSGKELARYYYDLQLSTSSDVITLMRGRFELVYEVTY